MLVLLQPDRCDHTYMPCHVFLYLMVAVFNLTYKDQGRFDEARQKLKRYAIEHQDEIAAAKARKASAC